MPPAPLGPVPSSHNRSPTRPSRTKPVATHADRHEYVKEAAPAVKPPRERERERDPPSPRKKSSSKKPQLPTPPEIIVDNDGDEYHRGDLLGTGGFARVYGVTGPDGHKAFKVMAKSVIDRSAKTRAKVLAEIMIHKSLKHPNIVSFEDTFEDSENVYFKLELCENGSMNDIVKRRGKYSEPEARFFMVQILSGCQHMHANSVIHRDLKLGNIFLDRKMNVKIGDFGLAALLKYPEERKKTVCGTPNYIAPEVLYDQGDGHSFEVDVWSVGVILYTLLVGKPPFQTNNVQKIYDKIKHNDYEIPEEAEISAESQELIRSILTPIPSERPSLVEIMEHAWFRVGHVPLFVPATATREMPRLFDQGPASNRHNFERLKRDSLWDPDADKEIVAEADYGVEERRSTREELREQEMAEEKRERMEQEITRALQPGSPISALLRAGKQPLIKTAGPPSIGRATGTSLSRQIGAIVINRQAGENGRKDKENRAMPPPALASGRLGSTRAEHASEDRRSLSQKARLVAGMTAAAGSAVSIGSHDSANSRRSSNRASRAAAPAPPSSIDMTLQRLNESLRCIDDGELYEASTPGVVTERVADAEGALRDLPPHPHVFIQSWLDNSSRWGLAFALSNGAIGVNFRDASTMVLAPNKSTIDFLSTGRVGSASASPTSSEMRRDNYSLPEDRDDEDAMEGCVPKALAAKLQILRYHEKEIVERLYGANSPLVWLDEEQTTGMTVVRKWYRCHQAIVFCLSDDTIQFNFYDHVKIFLTQHGQVVSVIDCVDRTGGIQTMRSWTLEELVSIALPDRAQREASAAARADEEGEDVQPDLPTTRPGERRLARSVVKKLRYAREVLLTTISGGGSGTGQNAHGVPGLTRTASVSSVASNGTQVSRR